jgi:hypothetical protein
MWSAHFVVGMTILDLGTHLMVLFVTSTPNSYIVLYLTCVTLTRAPLKVRRASSSIASRRILYAYFFSSSLVPSFALGLDVFAFDFLD